MNILYNNICRLCLTIEGTTPIFDNSNAINSFDEKIMFCARVKISEDDGLPHNICNGCVQKLETAYYFRLQVESCDYKLKECLIVASKENENNSKLKSPPNLTQSNSDEDVIEENNTEKPTFYISTSLEDPIELEMNEFLKIVVKANSSKPEENEIDADNVIVQEENGHKIAVEVEPVLTQKNINLANDKNDKQGKKLKPIKKLIINKSLKVHPMERDSKLYQCDTCGKVFNKSSQLTVHIRSHTGEKPFICTTCGKSFRVHHHLQAHNRVHTAEKPFQCLHCGKCFSENSSLTRHTKIHTNDKKFICPHCSKRFITPADVRKHIVKHTGEKPFSCSLCNKKYSDPSSLNKHNKKHKDQQTTNEKIDNVKITPYFKMESSIN